MIRSLAAGPATSPPNSGRLYRRAILGLSAALWLAIVFCYYLRPDACAAVTMWPAWFWAAVGISLAVSAWPRGGKPVPGSKRAGALVVVLWLLYFAAFVEEPRSLMRRGSWPAPGWEAVRAQGRAVRVVSLNCHNRNPEQAGEVERYHPDIVLLQESPSREEVREVAQRLFGKEAGFIANSDTSIIARGEVSPLGPGSLLRRSSQGSFGYQGWMPSYLTGARVRLSSGLEASVISLHLASPLFDFKLWSRDCWRSQAANRRARAKQAEDTANLIASLPSGSPLIVGGDFNAPAGDAIYRPLRPRLHDSFAEGGLGWGNTAFNALPLQRPDQVWVSHHFRAVAVVARKTQHSDHRLVVCDLVMR